MNVKRRECTMKLTKQEIRKNILKAIRFECPDYVPVNFVINDACWHHYPQEELFSLMEEHPFLFPGFVRPNERYVPHYSLVAQKDHPYTDDFGCLWETTDDGITGTVVRHPLQDWSDFSDYKIPDPLRCSGIGPHSFPALEKEILDKRRAGELTCYGLRHGHTFLQLCDIRGYQNLIYDMMDENDDLPKLIDQLEQFNLEIVKQYLKIGVDIFCYPEDLGMQFGPMLSVENFQKYIHPSYKRLMDPARKSDAIVHMHSDGDIRLLAPYLIEGGVDVLNLQDLVNGLDWIKNNLCEKTCIELDIDRQSITPFGTCQEIDRLVRNEISLLGTKYGGLMLIYGLYPGVPLENIKALMDALEKYAFYFN